MIVMADERARRLRKSMTPQEVKLWVHLRGWRTLGYHFRRQRPHGQYIVDFVCLKHNLAIEVDGAPHGFHSRAIRDAARDEVLRADGLRVLRFWNNEVDRNLNGVLETILAALGHQGTPPTTLRAVPPPRSGEGLASQIGARKEDPTG
jgi:very-short-patch-repair endonuclease